VVPDKASVWYYVRNSDERIEEMQERVMNCARAAALATGTELAEARVIGAVHQRHFNKSLAELFQRNIELVGMPQWDEEEHEFARQLQENIGSQVIGMPGTVDSLSPPGIFVGGGSSDVGDVTLIAPTSTIRFPGVVPGAIYHHWSVVSSTYGSAAWKGLNAGAKVIAASAIDLLTIPGELEKAKKEFEEYSIKNPYRSFLPDDAEPYLELNRQQMDKYRPMLKQVTLD
jgi:aminobenzoyl-glutamate utilization protein B